jgi:hypothetical protein
MVPSKSKAATTGFVSVSDRFDALPEIHIYSEFLARLETFPEPRCMVIELVYSA